MPRLLSIPVDEFRNYLLKNAGVKTLFEMHIETGVASRTITNYASEMGLSLACPNRKSKRDRVREAILLHHETKTARQIAEIANVSRPTIYARAFEMGLSCVADTPRGQYAVSPVRTQKTQYFNYRERSNWLI